MPDEAQIRRLLDAARQARERAYAPYSNFPVGAALITPTGEIFSGCNIENASFGATVCAERVALFTAMAAGHRRLAALAIIADTPEPAPPCGLCRQVLAEFNPDCVIIMANLAGAQRSANLNELLPLAFRFPATEGSHGLTSGGKKRHERI
jgi:cytidine deaminase